jgi:hypothetical protein
LLGIDVAADLYPYSFGYPDVKKMDNDPFFLKYYNSPSFALNVITMLISMFSMAVVFVAGGKKIPFSKFPFNLIYSVTSNNIMASILWTFGVTINWFIFKYAPSWEPSLFYFNSIIFIGGNFFFTMNASQFMLLYLIGFNNFLLKPFDNGKIFESSYLNLVFLVSGFWTIILLIFQFVFVADLPIHVMAVVLEFLRLVIILILIIRIIEN